MNIKLKSMAIMFLTITCISFAKSNEAPSYNEIFSQQLKCNTKYFSTSLWDKKQPLLAKMDSGTVVVISKPTILEIPATINPNVSPEYKNKKKRNFKINSTLYTELTCSSKEQLDLNALKGTSVETLVKILETKTGTGVFHIVGGEPSEFAGADPKINSDYLYYAGDSEDKFGFFCVVLVDNFVRNPKAIDLDKLCAGKSAKDREATKKAIEQMRNALKATGANKTK